MEIHRPKEGTGAGKKMETRKEGREAEGNTETLEEEAPWVPGGRPALGLNLQRRGWTVQSQGLPVTSTFRGGP